MDINIGIAENDRKLLGWGVGAHASRYLAGG